ncbi:MAG TPA: hypothetical protein VE777_18035 [Gaiellales bacterium]|nr:hypothetical protein [Gaiellales bacterium]
MTGHLAAVEARRLLLLGERLDYPALAVDAGRVHRIPRGLAGWESFADCCMILVERGDVRWLTVLSRAADAAYELALEERAEGQEEAR